MVILGEFDASTIYDVLHRTSATPRQIPSLKLKAVEITGSDEDAALLEATRRYFGLRTAVRQSPFYSYLVMEVGEKTFGLFNRTMAKDRRDKAMGKRNFLEEVQIMVDICPTTSGDPWDLSDVLLPEHANEVEQVKKRKSAKAYREKHLDLAAEILGLQHRTHVFTVSIHGSLARLLYIDRGGALVSKPFNYLENSTPLEELLSRYKFAASSEKGFDGSAQRASLGQEIQFEQAIREYLYDKDNICLPSFHDTLVPGARTWVLHVPQLDNDTQYSKYIVQRPFCRKTGLDNNATRCYLAWGCSEKKVVFLKDLWRQHGCAEPETSMYTNLIDLEVPNLPTVHSGGDIIWEGSLQYAAVPCLEDEEYTWPRPEGRAYRYVHHRLVQSLALPLRMVRSSRQLIQVLRDVLETIHAAYKSSRVLHTDISLGNILIDENSRGLLIDWELAAEVPLYGRIPVGRRGTWLFMSIAQLARGDKEHSIADDVESCFWVLYCVVLHYFKGENTLHQHVHIDELFEQEDVASNTGGLYKRLYLTTYGVFKKITFDSKPLTRVIRAFAEILTQFYQSPYKRTFNNDTQEWEEGLYDPVARDAAMEAAGKITGVTEVVRIFDEALESLDWPQEDDAVRDLWPGTAQWYGEHDMGWMSLHEALHGEQLQGGTNITTQKPL